MTREVTRLAPERELAGRECGRGERGRPPLQPDHRPRQSRFEQRHPKLPTAATDVDHIAERLARGEGQHIGMHRVAPQLGRDVVAGEAVALSVAPGGAVEDGGEIDRIAHPSPLRQSVRRAVIRPAGRSSVAARG